MTRILAAALVVAGFTACSENELHAGAYADGSENPDIVVTPTELDFGTRSAGESEVMTFTMTNEGPDDLTVEWLELKSDTESFTILTDLENLVLPYGSSQEVEVVFEPMADGLSEGRVLIHSDDPDDKVVEVDLLGGSAVPELDIDPADYDFGEEYIGCEEENIWTLSNVGSEDLEITAIDYDADDALLLLDWNTLPMTLAPGESTEVTIVFQPDSTDDLEGTLSVTSNDPRGVVDAIQTATGVYVDSVVDEFEVDGATPVDIIFAVDQSCSMDDDTTRLANNFSTFIGSISDYSDNWRIGVVTDDDGCFNNGIITSGTSNYESVFSSAVTHGSGGWYTEALLTLAYRSIQETTSSGCNPSFLRPDALLHVIMVSDEREQSSSSYSSYVTLMQSYVSDPSLLMLSAVAGDYPSGCGTAEAGDGYYQAVMATGGVFLSICSTDWSAHVEDLAAATVAGLNSYELSSTPDESSIRVWVDGVELTSGWSYDSATNKIELDDQPDEGSIVKVAYGEVAVCDE